MSSARACEAAVTCHFAVNVLADWEQKAARWAYIKGCADTALHPLAHVHPCQVLMRARKHDLAAFSRKGESQRDKGHIVIATPKTNRQTQTLSQTRKYNVCYLRVERPPTFRRPYTCHANWSWCLLIAGVDHLRAERGCRGATARPPLAIKVSSICHAPWGVSPAAAPPPRLPRPPRPHPAPFPPIFKDQPALKYPHIPSTPGALAAQG